MSTVPFTQPGQTGTPGNTGSTAPLDYGFLAQTASYPTTNTGNPNTGLVPTPYTANNYQDAGNVNNPFANYTGFNLGLNSANELQGMYGPLGTAMYYYLNNGAGYNPSVLNSLINQIQPQVQGGLATLGATAGMTGNRFGSAYQLGTADYLSQVNQNELGMASGLYQQSQSTINNDMMSILGDAWKYKNNQGSILPLLISSILPTLANKIPSLGGNTAGTGPFGGTPPTFPGNPTYPGPVQTTPQGTAGDSTARTGVNTNITLNDPSFLLSSLQNYLSNPTTDNWQTFLQNTGVSGGVPTDAPDQTGFLGSPGLTPPGDTSMTDITSGYGGFGDYGANFDGSVGGLDTLSFV
jgi:hypothetical protein